MEVTTVAAQGEAEANFNLVGFSLSLSEVAGSVPLAKAKLKARIEDLDKTLTEIMKNNNLEFVKNSVRSSSHAAEKHEWRENKNVFLGHEVTYTLYFELDDMKQVNNVYEALTSLDRVRVGTPSFLIKDNLREKLNKKALKDAFSKVQERFDMECKVLGLDSNDYEVASWEVNYSDSRRNPKVFANAKTMSVAGGARVAVAPEAVSDAVEGSMLGDVGGSGAINFVTGLAHVTVNLEVAFQPRQHSIPLRAATVVSGGRSTKVQDTSTNS